MKLDRFLDLPRLAATPVYFGPVTGYPSWTWVGQDVAAKLSERAPVHYFRTVEEIPEGALVFWIKNPGTAAIAAQIARKSLALLFFPVDCFDSAAHIAEHRAFIAAARLICLHSRSLAPYFAGARLAFVDHYRKYGVAPQQRRPGKEFLWIGGYQYVPYVLHELARMERRPPHIVLLTNHESAQARQAARLNAEKAGCGDFERWLHDGSVSLRTWSEAAQEQALLTCRAAFDVKYVACFNQLHKPPTKIQKYMCSGIPCAINAGVAYLDELEFSVPGLADIEALSHDPMHCEQVERDGERLARRLTLERVSEHYAALAEQVLALAAAPYGEANRSIP